jgi:hypothetical protein
MLVLLIPVILRRDVSMTTLLIVMIPMHVLLTDVIALPDVFIQTSAAMIEMLVPKILVLLKVVASTNLLLVMMRILVQLILVVLLMDVKLLLKSVMI